MTSRYDRHIRITGRIYMDVRYINPFIEATQHVAKTMLEIETVLSRPTLKTGEEPAADICAVIGLAGDAAGNITLCFPAKTAVKFASKFAGEELTIDHPDLADALGELCNMVAGQAKAQLEGLKTSISLPRVMRGKDIYAFQPAKQPVLVLPFDTPFGRFRVEVVLKINKASEGQQAQESVSSEAKQEEKITSPEAPQEENTALPEAKQEENSASSDAQQEEKITSREVPQDKKSALPEASSPESHAA